MIKVFSAYTSEVDDPAAAAAEIMEQLDFENSTLKNSVGIIACHNEYIDTGVIEDLCDSLPFDVIGCTALGCGSKGRYGTELLCLALLTSDDVTFTTACTASIEKGDMEKAFEDAYNEARAKLLGDPSLIVSIIPILTELGGAIAFRTLDRVCGGVPIFGTLSSDQTLNGEHSQTIWNGKIFQHSAAMILMHGDTQARFFVTALPEQNIQKQKAIITESDDCILKKVNGMVLLNYLKTLGLTNNGSLEASTTIPFLVDYGEWTKPVALGMYRITPEGYAVCGGEMPEGAALTIGVIDYEGIIETATNTVERVLQEDRINGILMFPCLTRSLMLSPNSMDEMEKVADLMGTEIPYLLCYSGGEICPVYGEDGKIHNRFHNYTFTVCVF
jgi:hypothetical protein